MYLDKPHDKQWIADIETESLTPKIIWCLCAINVGTGEEVSLTDPDQMREWINHQLKEGCVFIGHNFLSFDVRVLNRLLGTRIPVGAVVDTFVLSMLYSPSLAGGHSLDAWGHRLGFKKTDFKDFSRLSPEMLAYCLNDCRVNLRLFVRLTERMRQIGFSERSCEIEHRAWNIIQQQRKDGFQLNVRGAHELFAELRQLENQIKDEIYEEWPPVLVEVKHFAKALKANGEYTANYARHLEQYPKIELDDDGSYRAFDWVEFNLGSPKQRVEKLLELGWKPREFTPKGQPKVTKKGDLVPSLKEFLEENPHRGAAKLAEWIAINARANMIGNWIEVADEIGLIHGNLWLAGSLRYRHDKPNTANIPAVRVGSDGTPTLGRMGAYTYEARDLWTTRDTSTRRLVGVDAKGIQLRILAHYLNDEEFSSAILSEDPHSANQKRMKLPSRALTKTITYATLMGAGDARIASEAKVNLKEARSAKQQFFQAVPGLPKLINRLQSELKRTGRITLCDGAKVLVPSDHMVIPYLLQGDESRIMKVAMVNIRRKVSANKLDVYQVGMIHDELQFDVRNDHVELFQNLCMEAFIEAGQSFDYNVPIEGDSKTGLTWSETH